MPVTVKPSSASDGAALTTDVGVHASARRALQLQAGLQDPVATVRPGPAWILSISTSGSDARCPWKSEHPPGFGLKAGGHIYHARM